MSSNSFPEFGKIISESTKSENSFPEFGKIISDVSPKSKEVAKGFRAFGYQPEPENIEKIRKTVGYPLKKFAGSLGGGLGDIYELGKTIFGLPRAKNPLPTSKDIEQLFENISGEKFEPTGLTNELIGGAAGGLGSILGLGGISSAGTPVRTAIRTGLAAIVPSTAGVLSEKLDLPPGMEAAIVVPASILAHQVTGKSMKTIAGELYNKADSIAGERVLPTGNLIDRLEKLSSKISEGLTTGPKSRIRTMMDEIKGKASGGLVKIKDLMNFRRDINEVSKEFTREQLKGSENYWKGLRTSVDKTIGEFEKVNPEFSQVYRQANSIYKGMHETNSIERFIKNNKILSGEAGLALKLLMPSLGLGGAIKGAASAKTIEFAIALAKNPGYRKAWQNVLMNASKNEVKATLNSLKKFNEMSEEEGIE